MGYLLGIDVGTTRTAAAVLRAGTPTPEMVTLGDHSVDIPSVVYAAADGSLLFGEAAERRALTEPDRVTRIFKRRIGDPTPIPLGEQAFTAEQLSALLAEHVIEVIARMEGGQPDRIALTHPASWGAHKRDLFADALAQLGLSVTFLTEPQAAALHYASNERVEPGATVAVYDLGGGTFDAAVVRKDHTGTGTGALFTLLGRPDGVEQLGGADFDQAVVDHVHDAVPQAFEALDDDDPDVLAQVARLRRDCCEAKEALSADTEVSIPVWLGEVRTTVRLHRSDFEDRIRPRLEESVEALRRAIASAGAGPSVVLLVGGSSRIPLVTQLVSSELGRPVQVDADPKNAIGKGAVLALGPTVPGGAGSVAPGPVATGAMPGAAPVPGGNALASDPGPLPWENEDEPATARMPAGDPRTVVTPHRGRAPHLAGPDADPPTDRLFVPTGGYAGYDDDATTVSPDPSTGRSPALLIGAGGVVAALAVVGAVFLWPSSQTISNATPELPAMPSSSAPVPTTTEQPAPTVDNSEPTRERTTAPRQTQPQQPAPPPVLPTPDPPTTTSVKDDPPVPPPVSDPPTPTTTTSKPPVDPPPGGANPPAPR